MIGIYKITNKINNHSYIGQSRNIEKRWSNHIYHDKSRDEYPLYRAFKKYGLENFNFEILEECSLNKLNEREQYYINFYKPEYNQTIGVNYNIVPQKLTYEEVQTIQQILIEDKEGNILHQDLANEYGVHKDTIRDINTGRTWFNNKLTYPLHYSKFDPRIQHTKEKNYCIDCGKEIYKKSIRCKECNNKHMQKELIISRDELKKLIRTTPFTTIGKQFNVSDNAIRKWCIKYNLPKTKKEINSYSDEEWTNI